MPELPEVETIRRVLEPELLDRRIEKIKLLQEKVVAYPTAAEFGGRLTGQTITATSRRGKFMRLHMESGDVLVLHLRMTGGLLLGTETEPLDKHTHVIFRLSDGKELRYVDQRRFGRFWLIPSGEEDTISGIHRLGLEPFDEGVTAEYLCRRLGRSRRAIKECLLDQSVVAGIGNIYSDEILYCAEILPSRPANSLTAAEWHRLSELIPEQLEFFIEKNAIPLEEYLAEKGENYRNTPYLQVYGHAGKPCPKCGQSLIRMVISGRSSVYCEHCQR